MNEPMELILNMTELELRTAMLILAAERRHPAEDAAVRAIAAVHRGKISRERLMMAEHDKAARS